MIFHFLKHNLSKCISNAQKRLNNVQPLVFSLVEKPKNLHSMSVVSFRTADRKPLSVKSSEILGSIVAAHKYTLHGNYIGLASEIEKLLSSDAVDAANLEDKKESHQEPETEAELKPTAKRSRKKQTETQDEED